MCEVLKGMQLFAPQLEASCLQLSFFAYNFLRSLLLTIGALSLTIGALLLTIGKSLLAIEAFLLAVAVCVCVSEHLNGL